MSESHAGAFEARREQCSQATRVMLDFLMAVATNAGTRVEAPTYEVRGIGVTYWTAGRRFCRLDPKHRADHVWAMVPGGNRSRLAAAGTVSDRDDGPWVTVKDLRGAVRLVPEILQAYDAVNTEGVASAVSLSSKVAEGPNRAESDRPATRSHRVVSVEELHAARFLRAGTVFPDPANVLRVQIDRDVQGFVVYMMVVNGEVKKAGTTGRGSSSFKSRMFSTFAALRQVMTGNRSDRPPAKWRSRRLDPFKQHAPATILANHEIHLWATECPSYEAMVDMETELNNRYEPEWTKEGRRRLRGRG